MYQWVWFSLTLQVLVGDSTEALGDLAASPYLHPAIIKKLSHEVSSGLGGERERMKEGGRREGGKEGEGEIETREGRVKE